MLIFLVCMLVCLGRLRLLFFALLFWLLSWCIRGVAPVPHFLFGSQKGSEKRICGCAACCFLVFCFFSFAFFFGLYVGVFGAVTFAVFLLCFFGCYLGVFGALPPFPTSFLDPKKEAKKEYAAAPLLFFGFLFFLFCFLYL